MTQREQEFGLTDADQVEGIAAALATVRGRLLGKARIRRIAEIVWRVTSKRLTDKGVETIDSSLGGREYKSMSDLAIKTVSAPAIAKELAGAFPLMILLQFILPYIIKFLMDWWLTKNQVLVIDCEGCEPE